MENNKKALKKAMLLTTFALTSGALSMQASAEDKMQTEENYRIECEDIDLVDLSDKKLIKVETNGEAKYYFCQKQEEFHWDDTYSFDEIIEFLQMPKEDFLSSKRTKYLHTYTPQTDAYVDILNEENQFKIYKKSIDVYAATYIDSKWVDEKIIGWTDISTYSSTIMDETYTKYWTVDAANQTSTVTYTPEPTTKFSVCYGEERDYFPSQGYMTKEEIQRQLNNLNNKNKVYIKR